MAYCCVFLYEWFRAAEADLEEAGEASRKALQLDPELAEAHASRALTLSARKKYDEARKEFEMAIVLDSKLYEAHYFYARSFYSQGKLDEAIQWFESASRVDPTDFQAPSLLADAYRATGRRADAEATKRRALELIEERLEMHPDDASVRAVSGEVQRVNSVRLARQVQARWVLYGCGQVSPDLSPTPRALACSVYQQVIRQSLTWGFTVSPGQLDHLTCPA